MATRRDPPPTTRQVHALCRELLQESGRPWPATRAEASAMIARLRGRSGAQSGSERTWGTR
jgi:hypothetical protein